MSNYNSLKTTIDANIKQNGRQEITGQILNSVLNQMVTTLGTGYQFMGVAMPDTNPGTPDAKVFYIATQSGTYANFNNIVISSGEVAILKYDTIWDKQVTDIASKTEILKFVGLETQKANVYQDGNVLMIAEYIPSKEIIGNGILEVHLPARTVEARVSRNGTTDYLTCTKNGNVFTLPILENDKIDNIYCDGANVGESVEIAYKYEFGTQNEINNLLNRFADYDGQINNLDLKVENIKDEIYGIKTEHVTAYDDGGVIMLAEYSPAKIIQKPTKVRINLISSSATDIEVSYRANGVEPTLYQSLNKISSTVYEYDFLPNDTIINFYGTAQAGDTMNINYLTPAIKPSVDNLNAISTKDGKTWIAIGDSLTAYDALALPNYVGNVSERLKLKAINKGQGGTGYWKRHTANNAFYQRVPTFTEDADIITIFGSFNDLGTEDGISGASIIGSYSDNTESTIAGCMNLTIDAIITKYPNAVIGIIAPTPWSNSHNNDDSENYVNVLKQIAEYRSIPFLDLYHKSNLRPWDASFRETFYDTPDDGAHPNTLGHKRFSGLIMQFVNSLIY